MALEKCPHCPARVRKGSIGIHLRRCINYRRKVVSERQNMEQINIPAKKGRKKKDEKNN